MKVTTIVTMGVLFLCSKSIAQNQALNPTLPSNNPTFQVAPNPEALINSLNPQNTSRAAIMMYEQDAREYEMKQQRELAALREAYKDLGVEERMTSNSLKKSKVTYTHKINKDKGKKHFGNALKEITDMVDQKKPYSLKRAVFLTEHAYDTTLSYSQFERQISKLVDIIQLKMKQNHIAPNDNTGKIMAAFQFMADTITVRNPVLEKTITTYPKTYDMQDFFGAQDYRKLFVSKLIKTGKGQCHSLPLLYLILCQEIGAKAYLSFAPEHSYVKFMDDNGVLNNIELTNQMLSTDQFILESGYIKSSAIKSGIYMDTLGMDRVILNTVNDLSNSYVKKYGYDDFVLKCALMVTNRDSRSITGYMHVSNYYYSLLLMVRNQYQLLGYGQREFQNDTEFRRIVGLSRHWNKYIDDLGFASMPPDVYTLWLNSLKNESMRQQFLERKSILNNIIEH